MEWWEIFLITVFAGLFLIIFFVYLIRYFKGPNAKEQANEIHFTRTKDYTAEQLNQGPGFSGIPNPWLVTKPKPYTRTKDYTTEQLNQGLGFSGIPNPWLVTKPNHILENPK